MVKHHIIHEHDRELGVKPAFSGTKPNNYIELVGHPSLTPILFTFLLQTSIQPLKSMDSTQPSHVMDGVK
jgi:hypothetical protein